MFLLLQGPYKRSRNRRKQKVPRNRRKQKVSWNRRKWKVSRNRRKQKVSRKMSKQKVARNRTNRKVTRNKKKNKKCPESWENEKLQETGETEKCLETCKIQHLYLLYIMPKMDTGWKRFLGKDQTSSFRLWPKRASIIFYLPCLHLHFISFSKCFPDIELRKKKFQHVCGSLRMQQSKFPKNKMQRILSPERVILDTKYNFAHSV